MRLRVELRERENPRTYDAETGKDLTCRVREIQIKPLRRADAVLFKKRDDGMCPYIDKDTQDTAITMVPIERIEGTWIAADEQLFLPCGRGMDNFDLAAAREALIRLQSFPNPKGWWSEEIEQLNKTMEALFPGEEGEALHRQMTEKIGQKKA